MMIGRMIINPPKGYWLEDNINDNSVMSISIFIKEAIDDDLFDKYEWGYNCYLNCENIICLLI